jgi:hypothetical protein
MPNVTEISYKFKRMGESFQGIFLKLNILEGIFLTKMKPNIDTSGRSQCISQIPCQCGREDIGELAHH